MRPRSQFVCVGLTLALLALLVIDLHAWFGSPPSGKNPLPAASAQAAATKLAKEVYGDEFTAAKTSAQKGQLARKLLAKAGETENDLPGHYVLLLLSCDIAIQAGDVETAFLAVEQIGRFFDVNASEFKRDILVKSAAAAQAPAEYKAVTEMCVAVLDQAAGNDDFQLAAQLAPLAAKGSAKCKGHDLARQVRLRIAEIEELGRGYREFKAAAAGLDRAGRSRREPHRRQLQVLCQRPLGGGRADAGPEQIPGIEGPGDHGVGRGEDRPSLNWRWPTSGAIWPRPSRQPSRSRCVGGPCSGIGSLCPA